MERIAIAPKTYPIPLDLNPYELLCCLEEKPFPVLLESAAESGGLGRYSIVAADPHLCFESIGKEYRLSNRKSTEAHSGDPLEALQKLLKRYASDFRGPLPFYGGAIGTFSYDLKNILEQVPQKAERDVAFPDIWLGFYNWAFVFDHIEGTLFMVVSEWKEEPDEVYKETLLQIRGKLEHVKQRTLPERKTPPEFSTNMTREHYIETIDRIREYIRSGDIYQANYTQRFHTTMESDALSLYGKMRSVNPAPFAAYIHMGEFQVVSASPERFIRLVDKTIETRPIKGTRPRGATPEEDEANRNELIESEKDRAELLMIVDLERNDLGRIAETGTVEVSELFKLETYATVFHLVATVKARLKAGLDITDCLRAAFPGGSITGAPKIRAMEIIDELEPTARNLYTGSIGYIGYNGDADLNIVIRTVVCKDKDAWFQVGGGIVWDSDPEMEYVECMDKAKGQIAALSL